MSFARGSEHRDSQMTRAQSVNEYKKEGATQLGTVPHATVSVNCSLNRQLGMVGFISQRGALSCHNYLCHATNCKP